MGTSWPIPERAGDVSWGMAADHPGEDDLVALVLGRLGAERAEEVAAHLVDCPACREVFDGYADSIAMLLPASPRSAPPAGFEAQAALGRFEHPHRGAPGRGVGRASTRRWARLVRVAAVLVVGLVLGAGAVLGWPEDEPVAAPSTTSEPSATPVWHAALLTDDGRPVGTVVRSYSADGPVLVLEVTGGAAGTQLTCRLVRADGSYEEVAHWRLSDQRPNSWVIDTGSREPAKVQLLGEDAQVWATAEL